MENNNTKLKHLITTKLVCKYYAMLLQIIKEATKGLNSKTRTKTIREIQQQIETKYKEHSKDLLEVFEITKKLIKQNPDFFTEWKENYVSWNLWSIYYQIWQALNYPNDKKKPKKHLKSLNNLVRWEYDCWYSKLKFNSLIMYYKILDFLKINWKNIVWYMVFWLLISMWFIYYCDNHNNTAIQNKYNNKTIFSANKYFQKVWLSTWEINYLLKDDIIKNAKIIKYKTLSGSYIEYHNANYNIIEFAKNKIISSVCMQEHTLYNSMFKKDKVCFKYLDNVCEHKKYYINLIKHNKNTKDINIRTWLIYTKLLLKLWKCM